MWRKTYHILFIKSLERGKHSKCSFVCLRFAPFALCKVFKNTYKYYICFELDYSSQVTENTSN